MLNVLVRLLLFPTSCYKRTFIQFTPMDSLKNMRTILDLEESFQIVTVPLVQYKYRRYKNIVIKPKEFEWSFSSLAVFINELDGWLMDNKNGFRRRTRSNGEPYYFFSFYLCGNPKNVINLNIDSKIIVKASKIWLNTWNDVETKPPKIQKTYSVYITKPGTRALLRSISLFYYSKTDFSHLLHTFVASFVKNTTLGFDEDKMPIFNLYQSFHDNNYYESTTLKKIQESCEGYLRLYFITNNNTRKHLDSCMYDEKRYFILKGIYFTPFCCELVKNTLVQGMMLDTTWSVLKNYVVSIPTVIIRNVGLPIGFSFSLVEDFSIYDDFFKVFADVYGYPIPAFIRTIESDQGSALQSAVKEQGMNHLSCLRHKLVSLGRGKFSSQVGNLLSAACEKDYNSLKKIYEESWSTITDEEELEVLNQLLNKVGLQFDKVEITYFDEDMWKQVSMIHRPDYQMPSCTNQLESSHGHLNSLVPRRNELFSSLKRLIDEIVKKNKNFEKNFYHNYTRYKSKISRIVKNTPKQIIRSEIQHYSTNLETNECQCGESKLMSAMLGINLPCSHLYFLKNEFPEVHAPPLQLINSTNGELFFEHDITETKKITLNLDYFEKIRRHAYKMIKKYSHNQNKKEITSFVNDNLKFDQTPSEFILGYPIEIFEVIDKGILKFFKEKS